ncbi:MAG: hypothetical protein M3Y22_12845 [Pseudomonadota bacterium]|nr:hypothetical protein [Pseudomonadota bacterium]
MFADISRTARATQALSDFVVGGEFGRSCHSSNPSQITRGFGHRPEPLASDDGGGAGENGAEADQDEADPAIYDAAEG